jgi:Tfp pilus assembly protein PilX
MAGNMLDRNTAFQAGEAALRAGETWTLTNSGLADDAALTTPATWDGSTPAASGSVASLDDRLASDPVFHVGPPQRIRIGVTMPPAFRFIYPVTSRGEGGSDAAVVVLQSMFEIAD